MGIRENNLKWIESYLKNRFQRTICNGNLSDLDNNHVEYLKVLF